MAKIAMECPFSHKMCRDCAVYRGSHYFLCFKKEYRGCLIGESKPARSRNFYGMQDFSVDVPADILNGSVLRDVEDIVENEEFSKQKEREKM